MANIIAGVVVVLLVFLAVSYIVKEKKKGRKCMGCSEYGNCSKNCDK